MAQASALPDGSEEPMDPVSSPRDFMRRTRLIVMGPLPPPIHGVAVSTSLVLANERLRTAFEVEHIDTTDSRSIANMGRWDFTNIRLGVANLVTLARRLRRSPGILYLPLSETTAGFVRDSLFILIASVRGWKLAVHCRNSTFREFYGSRTSVTKAWIGYTLRRVDALAVLGESLRHLFVGLVPQERIVVVPNGTPDVPRRVEPVPHLVVYLSNLSRKKGADYAVRAALRVLSEEPQARFVFAGAWEDDDFEREVTQLARAAKGRISFLPPISGDGKHELLQSAWTLLFPVAWGEGHPRIVLEALAAGVPVVTTDRATIADTVGDAGFVLPDPEEDALADRILRLLRDVALRERMSAAARARYVERFTQQEADRRISEWLTDLADSDGQKR